MNNDNTKKSNNYRTVYPVLDFHNVLSQVKQNKIINLQSLFFIHLIHLEHENKTHKNNTSFDHSL